MSEQTESKTVKAGGTTYFFDLKQAKDDKPYLAITSSRFKGEKEERDRATIFEFPDRNGRLRHHAQDFLAAVKEMVARLG